MPQEGSADIGFELVKMGYTAPVPDMARRIVDIDPAMRASILRVLGSSAAIGFRRAAHSLDDELHIDNDAAEAALCRLAQLQNVRDRS